jgi:serine/threonine protein kinase
MIAQFMLGDLSLADLGSIEAHLQVCERCRRTASDFDALRDPLLLDLPMAAHPAPDAQFTRRWERLTKAIEGASRLPTLTAEPAAARPLVLPDEYPIPAGFERGPIISNGGFGVVFAARRVRDDAECVLKYPLSDKRSFPRLMARFQRECLVVKRLQHVGIVRYVDHGLAGPTPYLALERLHGQSLDHFLKANGPLPLSEVGRIAMEVLQSLAYLEDLGAVHRDLKPSNLFRLTCGGIRIIDWGLSSIPSAALLPEIDPLETGPWSTMGTPGYSAPEQVAHFAGCDIRADLYSLGWTLANLLTGKPPGRALAGPAQPLCCGANNSFPMLSLRPDLPPDWLAYIRQLVAELPEQRFPTAREALARLPAETTIRSAPLTPALSSATFPSAAQSAAASPAASPYAASPPAASPHAAGLHAASPPGVALPENKWPPAAQPSKAHSPKAPSNSAAPVDHTPVVALEVQQLLVTAESLAGTHRHTFLKRGVELVRRALQRETIHVLITGATGVGKSTVVRSLLPELPLLYPHFENGSHPAEFSYASKASLVAPKSDRGPLSTETADRFQMSLPADFLARGFFVTEFTAHRTPSSESFDFWLDADLVVAVLSPDAMVLETIRERFLNPLRHAAHQNPLWLVHRMDTLRRAREVERLRNYAQSLLLTTGCGSDVVFSADGEDCPAEFANALRSVQTWLIAQRGARMQFLRHVRPLMLLRDIVQLALTRREMPQATTESLLVEIDGQIERETSRRESH